MPGKAVIYTRVSTGQQTEGTSLAAQFAACKRQVSELGAELTGFFEETASGALFETREQFQKALAAIESGQADTFVIAKLDRTGRDVDDLREVRRRVEAAGGRIVFADGLTFQKGAVGNLLFTQLSAFAEFERELIRERTVNGMENQAKAGLMPCRSQSPFGYHLVTRDDVIRGSNEGKQAGQFMVVESEAQWIPEMFERIADMQSLRQVCAWLTDQEVSTKKGSPWHPSTLRNMIVNPIYKGQAAWRKTKAMTDESRAAIGLSINYVRERPEQERIYLPAPALVDAVLWQRANDVMAEGRALRSGANAHKYMLAGLLFCPRCGGRVYARNNPLKYKGKRYDHHHYGCAGKYFRQPRSIQTCDLPTYSGPATDAMVINCIETLLRHPEWVQAAQARFKAQVASSRTIKNDEAEARKLRKEIEKLAAKEKAAASMELEARLEGGDGNSFRALRVEAEDRRKVLEFSLECLEDRLRGSTAPSANPVDPSVAERVLNLLRSDAVTDAGKGLLLRHIIARIHLVEMPAHLRTSARMLRLGRALEEGRITQAEFIAARDAANGHNQGGINIVLASDPDGPLWVLSHIAVGVEHFKDANYRQAIRHIYETTLRIEPVNPFPLDIRRASRAERDHFNSSKQAK